MDSNSTNVPVLYRGCGYKGAHSLRSYLAPHSLAHYQVGRVARMKGEHVDGHAS
jgi:hypothetical protein